MLKELRSTVYVNKKVLHISVPEKSYSRALREFERTADLCNSEISYCRRNIKMLYQSEYSKHNPFSRRVADREKGFMSREYELLSKYCSGRKDIDILSDLWQEIENPG